MSPDEIRVRCPTDEATQVPRTENVSSVMTLAVRLVVNSGLLGPAQNGEIQPKSRTASPEACEALPTGHTTPG